MAGEATRVMLFPRYSSLAGATSFVSAPFNTRTFYECNLTMWRGTGVGVTTFSVNAQLSQDMRYWLAADGSPWTISADTETDEVVALDREWMRLVVTLTGSDAMAPLWILGEFLRREA